MFRRMISLSLSLALCVSLLPVTAMAAEERTYTGAVLAAVNVNTGSDTAEGSFTAADTASGVSGELLASGEDGEGFFDECGMPERPQELAPPEELRADGLRADVTAAYAVGSTKTIYDYYTNSAVSMQCLYIGVHCTVWGSTSDPEATRIPADAAQRYGDGFDSYFETVTATFGTWVDADGDGKVALLCYDLQSNYARNTTSTVAGYFYSPNLLDANMRLDNVQFNYSSQVKPSCFGMDCIHVDTARGRESVDDFSSVSIARSRISTAMHEFQHLINASWSFINNRRFYYMESVMDEGMARSAQFLCDPTFGDELVEYFNRNTADVTRLGLYHWQGGYGQYIDAFLLLQYIRTRYAQQGHAADNGNGVYRALQELRCQEIQKTGSAPGNTAAFVAQRMFDTDLTSFTMQLWQAVYLKENSGPLGFNGEAWASRLRPYLSDLSDGTSGISNGGVRYYYLESGQCTVTQSKNLQFAALPDHIVDGDSFGAEGNNLNWNLSAAGTLTVSGSGEMEQYLDNPPWRESFVRSLVIEEGVTSIGQFAFQSLESLTEVSLPESLASIGWSAFARCSKLKEVVIPRGVTEVYGGAFSDCDQLTAVRFLGDAPSLPYAGSLAPFPVGATLYYLQGRSGWDGAGSGRWNGYRTVCWGTADDALMLTKENDTYRVSGSAPGGVLCLAVYGSGQRLRSIAVQELKAGVAADMSAAAGGEDTVVKVFLLTVDYAPVKGALVWSDI